MDCTVKKKKIFDFSVLWFWVSLAAYSAVTCFLFYKQCVYESGGPYLSDMPAYLQEALGNNTTYTFPYRLFFLTIKCFYRLVPIAWAGALATTLFNSLNFAVLYYVFREYYHNKIQTLNYRKCALLSTLSSSFVSMMILPIDKLYIAPGQYFIGQGSGNIWHNATYLATRPFATVAFFVFCYILSFYETKTDWKMYAVFAVSLFLSTFTKPSFTFAFLLAAAVVLLARLMRNKWKTFTQTLKVSLCVIPSILDLLRQYALSSFSGSEAGNGSIAFGFQGLISLTNAYSKNWVFSLLMLLGFPLAVLWVYRDKLKTDTILSFGWMLFLSAKAESMLLYETGFRMMDGNFNWGNQHAVYYLMTVSLIILITNIKKESHNKIGITVCQILYLWHLISGCWYFVHILLGGKFY